ncbi:MAG: HD domain-containing protein, partial [Clostridia bacterium]|nr:HD domain-containing protein [Clostridia bacterium]
LMYYPAAQRMHHAQRSGLLNHVTSMLRAAEALFPCYPFLDADLVRAGVIVHDLSKITEMLSDTLGNVSEYSTEGLLLGHLVVGVSQVREIARQNRIPADDEYSLLLQHMIISHHGLAEHGSPRPPMFPEAEMLSIIDEMDARMNEMEAVTRRTPRGVFSEKIWSLDRRLYHPRYLGEPEISEPVPFMDKSPQEGYEGLL